MKGLRKYKAKDIFEAIIDNNLEQVKFFLDRGLYNLSSKQKRFFYTEQGDKVERRIRLCPMQLAANLDRKKIYNYLYSLSNES